jgi:hypothetical protein
MPPRRSARLQDLETQEGFEIQQPLPSEGIRNSEKRKAEATHAGRSAVAKEKTRKSVISQRNKPQFEAPTSSCEDALLSLPLELLHMILDNVGR